MKYLMILLSLALLPVVAEAVTEHQINDLIAKTSENSATLKQLDKRLTLIEQDLRALSNRVDANKNELSNKIDTTFHTLLYTFVGFQMMTLLAIAGLWFKDRPSRVTTTEPATPPESEPETVERLTPNV